MYNDQVNDVIYCINQCQKAIMKKMCKSGKWKIPRKKSETLPGEKMEHQSTVILYAVCRTGKNKSWFNSQ